MADTRKADHCGRHLTPENGKLGQHVVLSLPKDNGCDVIASLPKAEAREVEKSAFRRPGK